jgi:hypothetical protein
MSDDRISLLLWRPEQAHAALQQAWVWAKAQLVAGHRLVVEMRVETRSDAQNRLLHSRFNDISKQLEWAGKKRDTGTWKRLLVAGWLRSSPATAANAESASCPTASARRFTGSASTPLP